MTLRKGMVPALAVLLVLIGGGLGFLVYTRLMLGLTLEHQAALLGLPAQLEAEVRARNQVKVRLDGLVSAQVPLKQTFMVPLRGNYQADVAFDTEVPLRTVIRYQGSVPVTTTASLVGSTGLVVDRAWLPKFPLRAQVPLRFDIPVDLVVPVDTRIRLAYRGPVSFSFNQNLAVPIDTVLKTSFPLARDTEAPVRTAFRLRAYPPRVVPVVVEHARLQLPLSGVRLQRAD